MQLVAYGAQDVYLTGNPKVTFFQAVYKRHTNFEIGRARLISALLSLSYYFRPIYTRSSASRSAWILSNKA